MTWKTRIFGIMQTNVSRTKVVIFKSLKKQMDSQLQLRLNEKIKPTKVFNRLKQIFKN